MSTIFAAIVPVFLLIVLGHVLKRRGFPTADFWSLNDRLVYWILMPALFFAKTSTADLSDPHVLPFAGLLLSSVAVAMGFALLVGRAFVAEVAATILQGCMRFNTFVGVAIADAVFGVAGLELAVLAAAILVPFVNVVAVSWMVWHLGGSRKAIGKSVLQNPFIMSIALGLLFNVLGLAPIPLVQPTLLLLGQAALPIMLLSVGANLKLSDVTGSVPAIGLSLVGKFLVWPLAVVALAAYVELAPLYGQVALVFAAIPVSAASYTLVKELKGDAPLMASIITTQTILSALTVPLTLWLVEHFNLL